MESQARNNKFGKTLLSLALASLLGSGSALAVLKANGAEIDRRVTTLERRDIESRDMLVGVIKDVEWLVRDRGGTPYPKINASRK